MPNTNIKTIDAVRLPDWANSLISAGTMSLWMWMFHDLSVNMMRNLPSHLGLSSAVFMQSTMLLASLAVGVLICKLFSKDRRLECMVVVLIATIYLQFAYLPHLDSHSINGEYFGDNAYIWAFEMFSPLVSLVVLGGISSWLARKLVGKYRELVSNALWLLLAFAVMVYIRRHHSEIRIATRGKFDPDEFTALRIVQVSAVILASITHWLNFQTKETVVDELPK
ncbi:hypothetical protein OAU50_00805 [Planctomycetota bacterium]|nr:hypothetical protein [Planctomycetota bacterium]